MIIWNWILLAQLRCSGLTNLDQPVNDNYFGKQQQQLEPPRHFFPAAASQFARRAAATATATALQLQKRKKSNNPEKPSYRVVAKHEILVEALQRELIDKQNKTMAAASAFYYFTFPASLHRNASELLFFRFLIGNLFDLTQQLLFRTKIFSS